MIRSDQPNVGGRHHGIEAEPVHLLRGEGHDGEVHPVLLAEHALDALAVVGEQTLEEADGESLLRGLGGEDGGRELLRVSGEDDLRGAQEAEQGERLGGLGGLVEQGEVELLVGEDAGLEAGEGDADDLRSRTERRALRSRARASSRRLLASVVEARALEKRSRLRPWVRWRRA